jgi:hypothetical protein
MGKRNPGKLIESLDAIGRKMDALRAGALTTEEAIAKAAKKADELREMFPLDIDALFEPGMNPKETLDAIKKFQESDFGPNLQTKEWFASQTPQEQMRRLREEEGPVSANLQPGEWRTAGGVSIAGGRPGIAWGELFTPEQTLAGRGIQGPANLVEANAFADALEGAVKRFEAGFPNSYFTAVVLAMEIPYLRIGARSVAQAKLYIQSFAPFFLPGFQKAVIDPNMSATARSLTQEAITILTTGQVSASGGGVIGGALPRLRPPPPIERPTPSEAVDAGVNVPSGGTTAGISGGATPGGGIALATRADVAALGASLSRSVEQQTTAVRGISTAVTAQTREVQAARTAEVEANRRLVDQFNAIHAWNRRIEDGLLRPMQQNVTEIRRSTALGASMSRDLADALQRLQFSGALSPGSTV